MNKPSISDRAAGMFFPSAADGHTISRTLVEQPAHPSEKPRRAGRRGISRTLVEQNRGRVAKYRKAWKKKGLTQTAVWLPTEVAKKLKAKSVAGGKSISTTVAEILKEAGI